jgi:hypothetical protein
MIIGMSKLKKIIPYVLILTALVGLFSPASGTVPQVHAQTILGSCTLPGGSVTPNVTKYQCSQLTSANPIPWTPNGSPLGQYDYTLSSTTGSSGSSGGFCAGFLAGSICGAFSDLLMIPMILTSWVLWLGGVLLNWVLNYTVTNLTANISSISGIALAWSTIRDLFNILFIFILLYVAIGTIIGMDRVNWKKTLTGVVIAVIFINFSMFFTEVIIDASNVVTLGFYNQIVPSASVANGLSNSIMQPLGLNTFYNPLQGSDLLDKLGKSLSKVAIVSLGSSAFMAVTAFVFLAVAIMFIVRFVTFVFLLILSPIMVMGSVLPRLGAQSSKWWKQLTGQAIFAPLFMIMIWVVLTIVNSPAFLCHGGNMSDIFTGAVQSTTAAGSNGSLATSLATSGGSCGGGSMGLIMNYIVVISFIIGALTISKEVSEQGGSAAQKLVGGALGFGVGAVGYAGRRTIGSAGRALSDNEKLKENASKGGVKGLLSRTALKSGQKAATSSFDVRSSKFAGMGKTFGMGDLGIDGKAGGKGGYDAYTKKKAEDINKFVNSLKPSDIEIDKARQAVKNTREGTPERAEAQKRLEELEGVSKNEVIRRIRNEKNEKIKEATEASGINVAKQKEKELQDEVAKRQKEIEGTAILELRQQREAELDKIKENLTAQTKEREGIEKSLGEQTKAINADYDAREKNAKEIPNAEKRRKEGYASTVSKPGVISTYRVGFVGKVRKQNLQAAAQMRGVGGKSKKERLAELAKEVAEEEDKAKKENEPAPDTSTTTPPTKPTATS